MGKADRKRNADGKLKSKKKRKRSLKSSKSKLRAKKEELQREIILHCCERQKAESLAK